MDEDHPFNNRTLYGAYKVGLEHMLRSFNEMYGLPYTALRYFNVYGPRMDLHGVYTEVMIRWMDRIDRGEPQRIFGDGLQRMDFVYVGDIARANILALTSDASDMYFNVASGTQTTLSELSTLLCEVMGRPELRAEHFEERKVNPVRHRLGGATPARRRPGVGTGPPPPGGVGKRVGWGRGGGGGGAGGVGC